MSVPGAKRLKDLKSENGPLKKLLAKQLLENEVIKDGGGVGCTNVGYGCNLNFVAVWPAREHLVDREPVDEDRHVRSVTLGYLPSALV